MSHTHNSLDRAYPRAGAAVIAALVSAPGLVSAAAERYESLPILKASRILP
jgi:hypothetical protein